MPVAVRLLAFLVAGLALVGAAYLNGWSAKSCAGAREACAQNSDKKSRTDGLSSSNCFVQEAASLGKRPVTLATEFVDHADLEDIGSSLIEKAASVDLVQGFRKWGKSHGNVTKLVQKKALSLVNAAAEISHDTGVFLASSTRFGVQPAWMLTIVLLIVGICAWCLVFQHSVRCGEYAEKRCRGVTAQSTERAQVKKTSKKHDQEVPVHCIDGVIPPPPIPHWSVVRQPKQKPSLVPESSPEVKSRAQSALRDLAANKQAAAFDSEYYFCPDLVVPKQCECVLVVPLHPLSNGALEITDSCGSVILRVEGTHSGLDSLDRNSDINSFTLHSAEGQVLATCHARARQSSQEYVLVRGTGEEFAKLARNKDQDSYAVVSRTGETFDFWGAFDERAVNVADTSGRIIATTELLTASSYKVLIAPLMDAGIVICSLLCLDHLRGRPTE